MAGPDSLEQGGGLAWDAGHGNKTEGRCFKTHLWIVVSEVHPQKKVVLAFNLTDRDNYPTCCCILNPGEHEYIEKPSAVRYFSPKLWDPQAQLAAKIKDGTFEQYQDASEALLEKIVAAPATRKTWTRIFGVSAADEGVARRPEVERRRALGTSKTCQERVSQ